MMHTAIILPWAYAPEPEFASHASQPAPHPALPLMKAGAHVLGVLQRVARVEIVDVRKLGGLQEVQQRPELAHAVLQRRARDEQLVLEVPRAQLLRT